MTLDVEAGHGDAAARRGLVSKLIAVRSINTSTGRRLAKRIFIILTLALFYIFLIQRYPTYRPLSVAVKINSTVGSWKAHVSHVLESQATAGHVASAQEVLSCPAIPSKRYDYLRKPALQREDAASADMKFSYFFALDLFESASVIPTLFAALIQTIKFLGPENCALSIIEGRSKDGTREMLEALKTDMTKLNVAYFLGESSINPKEEGRNRIADLAELRNQALKPLTDQPNLFYPDTTITFINDVSLCSEDILELIHQKQFQDADMTCAMDWIYGGSMFYDVWVARGMNGDTFFEIPQTGSWDFAENLFWNSPETKKKQDDKHPYQVYACWNGLAAFTARPFLKKEIQFRASREGECFMGEPTLLCKDFWAHSYHKIAVVPAVNVGYNDDESRKVKARHGYVSDHVYKPTANDGSVVIQWKKDPPGQIKCAPDWGITSWVPPL